MPIRQVFFATNRIFDPLTPAFGSVATDPPGRLWAGVVDCKAAADPAQEPSAGIPEIMDKDDPDSGLVRVLKEWLAEAEATGAVPLLFVHGFNYSFADAVGRTAALCLWLEDGGAAPLLPLSFSWPSNGMGSPDAYLNDQQDSAGAGLALARLVLAIARLKPNVRPVYLAHSMGARATRCGMQALAAAVSPLPIGVFRQAVIMAGDDVSDVLDDAGPALRPGASAGGLRPLAVIADWVTIGVNRDDGTVWLISGALNQGDRLGTAGPARPGDLPDNVKVVDYSQVVEGAEIKPVPQTQVEMNWIGHQYFRNDRRVRQDLLALLAEDTAPEKVSGRRWGVKVAAAISEMPWRLYPV